MPTGDDASPEDDGPTGGGQVELIVDIGAMVTKIAVHRAGHPLFVRMVRLGGDGATSELQKVLDLSWEDAEQAKLDASVAIAAGTELDPDDERARVLSSSVRRLVTGVRDSLDYFRSQHEGIDVQRVLLAGGATLAPGLADQLRAALELPVEVGDPLRTLEGVDQQDDPQRRRQFLAVPIGLAMGLLR